MNPDEIRKKRDELASEIKAMLQKFCNEAKVSVTGIDVTTARQICHSGQCIIANVSIKTEL